MQPRNYLQQFFLIGVLLVWSAGKMLGQPVKSRSKIIPELTKLGYSKEKRLTAVLKNGDLITSSIRELPDDILSVRLDTVKTPDPAVQAQLYKKLNIKYDPGKLQILPEWFPLDPRPGSGRPSHAEIAFVESQPLSYNFDEKRLEGSFTFFLIDRSLVHDASNTTLAKPITVDLHSADLDFIEPRRVTIRNLYLPGVEVAVQTTRLELFPLVKLRTLANPDGYATQLKTRPAIELTSAKHTAQGLGIEEIPITAKYISEQGGLPITVAVGASRGSISSATIELHPNQAKTVNLRSAGIGSTSVQVQGASVASNTWIGKFRFPFVFLAASLLGGIVGATIRNTNKNTTTRKIVIGALIGLVAAAAYYALGINLLGISIHTRLNELAVFALAALAGYAGIKWPRTLAKPPT